MLNKCLKLIIPLLITLLLSSCGGDSSKSIQHQIKAIKDSIHQAMKSSPAKPSPKQKTKQPQPTTKSAKKRSNPFSLTDEKISVIKSSGLVSYLQRGKLTLTGTLTQDNKKWAILRDVNGKLFVVTQGSTLGKKQAIVKEVTGHSVTIVVGDGEDKREYKLTLKEPKE